MKDAAKILSQKPIPEPVADIIIARKAKYKPKYLLSNTVKNF